MPKRDFLAIADFSAQDLRRILDYAHALKREWTTTGQNRPLLANKSLAMIFQKPSLRTRVSFEMAMQHLGGYAFYLGPQEIGLGKREAISDIARVLSGYVSAIMARVFAHEHILELARWASVPVINGLSDYNHPCQAMADVMTIEEHFGRVQGLKVVFVGDGNNVAVSLMHAVTKLGGHFVWVGPRGYEPPEIAVEQARVFAAQSGGSVTLMHDPHKAVVDADVIYTDTWVSMGQEEEAQRRLKVFPPYQVNAALVAKAKPTAIVMHCLPAHRGYEITDDVIDGPQSVVFQQAHNRLHAQKGILVDVFEVGVPTP
ncbi:MAG: ornithine carbamoyltransferase [Chloroflexi bacterium]|nr:ornithine carbamoyltransferase [Chloroflexota bacterium]